MVLGRRDGRGREVRMGGERTSSKDVQGDGRGMKEVKISWGGPCQGNVVTQK